VVKQQANSGWRVAWGQVEKISQRLGFANEPATWRDERIAIVTDASQNPSVAISPSGRYVVTGDVWLSERSKLRQRDRGDADLELIAIAWEEWGVATFDRLVGMFGLAVWDRERQELYLGRDRSGARTVYYTTTGATRWVSSNLRALAPYRSNQLDEIALRDYLCCAFVPGDRTMWQDLRELRPGSWLNVGSGEIGADWQLRAQESDSERSLADWGEKLQGLLTQVTRECLPTGEAVGVFLSGGLDSSLITALAAKWHSAPVHTYSIHFGQKLANELEFSSLVANHCQTEHHILEIPLKQMWQRLPETMAILDDPIGDPLTVPNLLLGRLARQNVGIVLNGEGGDPCFGGPKNQPMMIHSLYGQINRQNSLTAYLQSFQKCAGDLPQLLKPDVWQRVKSEPSVFEPDLNSEANYLNRLMALNIKFKGADQIMTKVSNLTQAAGLQGRSPLFDSRVIDFSMQVPPTYKLSGTIEKAVLKQAAIGLLPSSIIDRPKSGMMVPVQIGFRDYWNRQAKGLLLNRRAKIAPYLNDAPIREWLKYEGDPWGRYGVKLWLLSSLEYWLQAN
jgi:asparagine synthase (glutamine-hydrolysing)